MKKSDEEYELRVGVPDGCRLVGCRTEGEIVVIVFEDERGPDIRPIGFCREHSGEMTDDEQ